MFDPAGFWDVVGCAGTDSGLVTIASLFEAPSQSSRPFGQVR
jgi:hypothetical protein